MIALALMFAFILTGMNLSFIDAQKAKAADVTPTVSILGATLRTEGNDAGKQSLRMGIKVSGASAAKACGIKVRIKGLGKAFTVVSTEQEAYRNLYAKDIENNSITYTLVVQNIPVNHVTTGFEIIGFVKDMAGAVTNTKEETDSDIDSRSVQDVLDSIGQKIGQEVFLLPDGDYVGTPVYKYAELDMSEAKSNLQTADAEGSYSSGNFVMGKNDNRAESVYYPAADGEEAYYDVTTLYAGESSENLRGKGLGYIHSNITESDSYIYTADMKADVGYNFNLCAFYGWNTWLQAGFEGKSYAATGDWQSVSFKTSNQASWDSSSYFSIAAPADGTQPTYSIKNAVIYKVITNDAMPEIQVPASGWNETHTEYKLNLETCFWDNGSVTKVKNADGSFTFTRNDGGEFGFQIPEDIYKNYKFTQAIIKYRDADYTGAGYTVHYGTNTVGWMDPDEGHWGGASMSGSGELVLTPNYSNDDGKNYSNSRFFDGKVGGSVTIDSITLAGLVIATPSPEPTATPTAAPDTPATETPDYTYEFPVDLSADYVTLANGAALNADGSVSINATGNNNDYITVAVPDDIAANEYTKVTIEYSDVAVAGGNFSYKYQGTGDEKWWNFSSDTDKWYINAAETSKTIEFETATYPVNKFVIIDIFGNGAAMSMTVKSIVFSKDKSEAVPTVAPATAAPATAAPATATPAVDNLIVNGDFSNGNTSWETNFYLSSVTVGEEGYASVTGRANQYTVIQQKISGVFSKGDTFDVTCKVRVYPYVKTEDDGTETSKNVNEMYAVIYNGGSENGKGVSLDGTITGWQENIKISGIVINEDTDSITLGLATRTGSWDQGPDFDIDDITLVRTSKGVPAVRAPEGSSSVTESVDLTDANAYAFVGEGGSAAYNTETSALDITIPGNTGFTFNAPETEGVTWTSAKITLANANTLTFSGIDGEAGSHEIGTQSGTSGEQKTFEIKARTDWAGECITALKAVRNGGNTSANITKVEFVGYKFYETKTYTRIDSVSDIQDGDKILMISNNNENKGSEIMLPEVIDATKSDGSSPRRGFAVQSANLSLDATITGGYEAAEWTFTKSGDNWLIGTADGYVALTSTADVGIAATLESTGNVFTIDGSRDAFTFTADNGNVLNRNGSRDVINGFANNPAAFALYRLDAE